MAIWIILTSFRRALRTFPKLIMPVAISHTSNTTDQKTKLLIRTACVLMRNIRLIATGRGGRQECGATEDLNNLYLTAYQRKLSSKIMANELEKLQSWYAAQCEDINDSVAVPWQHRYGIGISTSDNPAWNVGIELTGTDMEGATMSTIKIYNTDEDWYQCNIQKDTFHGVGDPSKLVTILEVFFQLVSERQGAESNSSLTNES